MGLYRVLGQADFFPKATDDCTPPLRAQNRRAPPFQIAQKRRNPGALVSGTPFRPGLPLSRAFRRSLNRKFRCFSRRNFLFLMRRAVPLPDNAEPIESKQIVNVLDVL